MARPAKPFFRKQTQSWYCSIGGRQISLGKDNLTAHHKFHEQMAEPERVSQEITTLYQISQSYLDWCLENRSLGTYRLQRRYLKSFIEAVGKQTRPAQLQSAPCQEMA